MEVRVNSKQTKTVDENKPVNDSEKGKAYRKKYMTEYMKDRRADDNFKNINSKHLGTRGMRLLKKEN